MLLEDAKIVAHEIMGDPESGMRRLVLRSEIAAEALPGQFVQLKVSTGLDPLLRRPISIAGVDQDKKEITLLYRLKGKGTKMLAQAKIGNVLNLLGPLGHGFTVPQNGTLYLVAGGIGAFPLLPLAQEAVKKGLEVCLCWGGENQGFFESAGLHLWQALGIDIQVSTMDGSMGIRGNVLDILNNYEFAKTAQVAVCGPMVMMAAVNEFFVKTDFVVEASLEERMGCGVGACLGCVCTLQDEQGKLRRGKVCKDGPVFKAKEVVWNAAL
ncbi:dihydroorotate dehydrogenase electron transfer subunit [Desulfitobacterium sp.]|uniref:dihydroorotate dehydrogenase electron transfer subunit n=1 Tax=Desulfitobacterium sp. TaxID=49981 RepID=UPI002B21E5FB|nr:dihydroorotate dehydrogenase electron transfer subunit [Desulfitobacterium sp.]MEA4900095.1 dihydroorotate dehydrogenase electron transfer subunit [Desulfitobacterium sp.]